MFIKDIKIKINSKKRIEGHFGSYRKKGVDFKDLGSLKPKGRFACSYKRFGVFPGSYVTIIFQISANILDTYVDFSTALDIFCFKMNL